MQRCFSPTRYSCLPAIVLVCFCLSVAQTKPADKQPDQSRTTAAEVRAAGNGTASAFAEEDYRIGPNDIIDIKIEDAPELSGTFRVSANGFINLPVVGALEVKQKTTEEITKTIAEKLAGGYLTRPIVTVSVKQKNTRTFFIQGAVHSPGMYQVEGRPTLLKLITIAGGLAENYGSTAFIIRNKRMNAPIKSGEKVTADNTTQDTGSAGSAPGGEEPEDYEILRANINNILRGHLDQNLIIQPGDIVHIPKTDVFFVAGDVKAPGTFSLKEGTTLRQAVSLAQGVTFEAAANQGVIFRENQGGARQEIKVDIAAVMVGKSPDIDIMPNDIVMVPNSRKKTTAKTLVTTALPAVLLRLVGIF